MKTIAYQGVKGAFSYITAVNEFGVDNNFWGMRTFKDVFERVEWGLADYAVIPVENSVIGSIYENYDLLNTYEMQIIGERFTKIEHCLLTVPISQCEELSLKGIKKVLSHPKALEQCACFLQKHPWMEAVVYMDTAAAAAEVATRADPSLAAIASAYAAEIYGLDLLKASIQDDPQNYTRFVTVTKNEIIAGHVDKCSLLLQLEHVPGALSNTLMIFAEQGINITKIESRPLLGCPFEYLFYVDIEFAGHRQHVELLLNELGGKVKKLKILGFYKRGSIWTN